MRTVVLALLFIVFLSACSKQNDLSPNHFVTWQGIGPDKWASIWLIKRHINPDAKIQWIPMNSQQVTGVAFDIPGAEYYRGKTTTFEQLIKAYLSELSPEQQQLMDIVHDIEITPWGGLRNANSATVELAFRGLQQDYGRENVSSACYLALFDNVSAALTKGLALSDPAVITPNQDCQSVESPTQAMSSVPLMTIEDILLAMQKGKEVIFLDAREEDEFLEGHIPGAHNVKLRDVSKQIADKYQSADVIVPHCIKDFRGYEVARKLTQLGLSNTVVMQPFGIKGWSDLNLPLQGSKKLTSADAQAQLEQCIQNPTHCLKS